MVVHRAGMSHVRPIHHSPRTARLIIPLGISATAAAGACPLAEERRADVVGVDVCRGAVTNGGMR